jgi:hypothetical protein
MRLSIPDMTPRADKVHVVRDNETETWRSDYTERKAGVVADMLLLGPRMSYTGADPNTGGGQVVLVLEGVLEHHGASLAAPALVALTRDKAALTFRAGADGLQALLQYPRRA